MNTPTWNPRFSILTLGALTALSMMLTSCGEQSGEQQSTAPTEEQSSEGTTQ